MPAVSVIIPAYNAARYLKNAVASVLFQTFKDWELLIVDDGSTDDTQAVVNSFTDPRIKYIRQENAGVASARNVGLGQAAGRYIAFLDADDIWIRNKLELQMAFMRSKNAAFTFTAYCTWEDKVADSLHLVPAVVTYRDMLSTRPIKCSTVIIDKQQVVPTMPDTFHEDLACWLKILKGGFVAHGLNEELCRYRVWPSQKSANKLHSAGKVWELYKHELGLSAPWYFVRYACNAVVTRIH